MKLDLFLQSWWSKTYNRPLKDPILQSYTTDELLYEYYDRIERERAAEADLEEESDKIEEKKLKDTMDWAEAEEQRELEAMRAAENAKKPKAEPLDPMEDPANQEWVKKQLDREIEEAKKLYGDDFGEDIEEDFNG